jgi:hypothetical protein
MFKFDEEARKVHELVKAKLEAARELAWEKSLKHIGPNLTHEQDLENDAYGEEMDRKNENQTYFERNCDRMGKPYAEDKDYLFRIREQREYVPFYVNFPGVEIPAKQIWYSEEPNMTISEIREALSTGRCLNERMIRTKWDTSMVVPYIDLDLKLPVGFTKEQFEAKRLACLRDIYRMHYMVFQPLSSYGKMHIMDFSGFKASTGIYKISFHVVWRGFGSYFSNEMFYKLKSTEINRCFKEIDPSTDKVWQIDAAVYKADQNFRIFGAAKCSDPELTGKLWVGHQHSCLFDELEGKKNMQKSNQWVSLSDIDDKLFIELMVTFVKGEEWACTVCEEEEYRQATESAVCDMKLVDVPKTAIIYDGQSHDEIRDMLYSKFLQLHPGARYNSSKVNDSTETMMFTVYSACCIHKRVHSNYNKLWVFWNKKLNYAMVNC